MIWTLLYVLKNMKWNFLFGGKFVLPSSGIVIFRQYPQKPKTQFQFVRVSGDELISLQYVDFYAWLSLSYRREKYIYTSLM